MIKKIIIVLLIVVILVSSVSAGWLDNWFNQQVSSGPNYFEGQKRGYFTAGSFSARIPSSTDYLFSIELPRLRSGCGGIDAFLGGFGFVNFDYLVQKFQRLIQAAPVVAFQIALNTLSSMLSTEVKDVEKVINALNSIQLNECAIMKPFTMINLYKDDVEKQFIDAAKAAVKTTGLTDLFTSVFAEGATVRTKSGTVSARDTYAGCGTELQALIDGAGPNKGVIGYIAERGGYNNLAPIIRGMIGDVVIQVGPSTVNGVPTEPCEENAFGSFKEGKLFKRSSPTAQGCVPDSVESLRDKVSNYLINAYLKARTRDSLTIEQQNLFKMSPLPVYNLVKYSVSTKDTSILPAMADPIAKGLLYQAFLDIYMNLYKILAKMEEISSKTNSGDKDKACDVSHIKEKLGVLISRAQQFYNYAESVYAKSLQENVSTLNVAYTFKNFEDIVYKQLSDKFSSSVAQRAVK